MADVYYKLRHAPHTNISRKHSVGPHLYYLRFKGRKQTQNSWNNFKFSWLLSMDAPHAIFDIYLSHSCFHNLIKYALHYEMGQRFIFRMAQQTQEINVKWRMLERGERDNTTFGGKRTPLPEYMRYAIYVGYSIQYEWNKITLAASDHINPMRYFSI